MSDLGTDLVLEFHETFECHVGIQPYVPRPSSLQGRILLEDYAQVAASAGKTLKSAAADCKAEGDEMGALLLIRLQLIQEELAELAAGFVNQDLVESFDALVDLSYVVDGTYITLGLHEHKEAGLREVHRSNMSKLDAEGRPIISEAGRVVKSELYSPPDLRSVLP